VVEQSVIERSAPEQSVFVKICGVTTVDDALLAAGLGADAVGLNFAAISPRRISVGRATEIVQRLPPEVLTVGIFRDELRDRVVEITNTVGLRAVQLHGRETAEDCRWVADRVPATIRALSIKDPTLASPDRYGADLLLVDSPMPGSGEVFDWSLISRTIGDRAFILAGGLDPSNVATAIEQLAPWGVDVASGVETSPGRKDPTKVRKFIQTARRAAEVAARSVGTGTDGLHPDVARSRPLGDGDRAQPYDWGEDL
jgi:phosphoribosylanthranilate isomerase